MILILYKKRRGKSYLIQFNHLKWDKKKVTLQKGSKIL